MRFPGLLGNEGLKLRLSAAGGRLSHCCILEGPAGSGKHTLARILAASMECEEKGDRPCGVCSVCRRVLKGEHPDVITVDSPTATVPIRLIRDMQADAYIKPNEGTRKVYLIPRAQDLQGPAQNALLKLLEEPPDYCAFLLLTTGADRLLPTVRSRAVTLSMSPLSREALREALVERAPEASPEELARAMDRSEGYLGAALELLHTRDPEFDGRLETLSEALASGDELALYTAFTGLEKLKRQDLLSLLSALRRLCVRAMDPGSIPTAESRLLARQRSRKQLFDAAEALEEAISMLQANGSPGHAIACILARL